MSKEICCPNCGHRELQVTTEVDTKTTGKNYSAGNGCLGYLLFGPLGLLCGSCGQKQKVTTTNTQFWVCQKCGNKFRSLEDLRKEAEEKIAKAKGGVVIGVIMAIITIIIGICFCVSFRDEAPTWVFFVFVILAIIVSLFAFIPSVFVQNEGSQILREIDDLETKMQKFQRNKSVFYNSKNSETPFYTERINSQLEPQQEIKQQNMLQNTITGTQSYKKEEGTFKQGDTDEWLCSCYVINDASVNFCPNCGKPKGAKNNNNRVANKSFNEWQCPNCGKIHAHYVGTCGCGTERP